MRTSALGSFDAAIGKYEEALTNIPYTLGGGSSMEFAVNSLIKRVKMQLRS